MLRKLLPFLGVLLLVPAVARAHIEVASGMGFANVTQEVAFGVGHGCSGADTSRVTIDLPAGVTSVRPARSDFGTVSVQKDAAGLIASVTWTKAEADVLAADVAYYKLVVRMKLPNAPFTTLYFPAHQTCRAADGSVAVVDWVALPTDAAPDGGEAEPAPALKLVPAWKPGWNKVTVPVAVPDPSVYLSDVAIVWKESAAYSAQAVTKDQIAATAGVSSLTSLSANDEIWVKYEGRAP